MFRGWTIFLKYYMVNPSGVIARDCVLPQSPADPGQTGGAFFLRNFKRPALYRTLPELRMKNTLIPILYMPPCGREQTMYSDHFATHLGFGKRCEIRRRAIMR